MSNGLEYMPFPQDSALGNEERFGMMIDDWYWLIDAREIGQITEDEAKQEEQEIISDLFSDAQEYFPDRDPWSMVVLARWAAINIYQMNNEMQQTEGAQDV